MGIERLIGHQRNPRCVLAKNRECIVKVIFAVEIGDVWRPQFTRFGALLLDPFRNLWKNAATTLPLMEILRATNGEFTISDRAVGSSKQIPGVSVFNDGR